MRKNIFSFWKELEKIPVDYREHDGWKFLDLEPKRAKAEELLNELNKEGEDNDTP